MEGPAGGHNISSTWLGEDVTINDRRYSEGNGSTLLLTVDWKQRIDVVYGEDTSSNEHIVSRNGGAMIMRRGVILLIVTVFLTRSWYRHQVSGQRERAEKICRRVCPFQYQELDAKTWATCVEGRHGAVSRVVEQTDTKLRLSYIRLWTGPSVLETSINP